MEDKFKKFFKKKNNFVFMVIFILGVGLMMIGGGDETKKSETKEKKLEAILNSVENIEVAGVYIAYTQEKGYVNSREIPLSAVISVKNAQNTYVKMTVAEAVSTALDIPIHKVVVLNKK